MFVSSGLFYDEIIELLKDHACISRASGDSPVEPSRVLEAMASVLMARSRMDARLVAPIVDRDCETLPNDAPAPRRRAAGIESFALDDTDPAATPVRTVEVDPSDVLLEIEKRHSVKGA